MIETGIRYSHPLYYTTRAPSQYPKRRLSVRSRKVSKPRDLYLELSDRSEIWQALRQQCCRCACQISKRYDNLKYQSRGFETLRDPTKRRLFGYWDGALYAATLCFPWMLVGHYSAHIPSSSHWARTIADPVLIKIMHDISKFRRLAMTSDTFSLMRKCYSKGSTQSREISWNLES